MSQCDVLIVFFLLFFLLDRDHRDLHVLTHSFPTRRSSDLIAPVWYFTPFYSILRAVTSDFVYWLIAGVAAYVALIRSEEHTSELQSIMRSSYAVFCLKTKITENNLPRTFQTTVFCIFFMTQAAALDQTRTRLNSMNY